LTKSFYLCSSCVYNDNGFKRNWTENDQKSGVIKTINVDEKINNYCCKLSNMIKIMLKYVPKKSIEHK